MAWGFLLSLLVVECLLRLAGLYSHLRNQGPPVSASRKVVLCVGDSYTWGVGARLNESWPAVLQQSLEASYPGIYQVVNRGLAGANSTQCLQGLRSAIDKTQPAMIFACTGSSNLNSNPEGARTSYSGWLDWGQDQLYKVRVYKLVCKLRGDPQLATAWFRLKYGIYYRLHLADPSAQGCFVRAIRLFKRGRLEEASYVVSAGLTQGGHQPQLRLLQCLLYLKLRDQAGAASLYYEGVERVEALVKQNPEDPLMAKMSQHLRFEMEGGHNVQVIHASNTKEGASLWFAQIQLARQGQLEAFYTPQTQQWLRRDLRRLIDICQQEHIPLVLLNYPNQFVSKTIEEVAAQGGLPCVDVETTFCKLPDPEAYFVADGHPNNKGYALMAQLLFPEVVRILPPPTLKQSLPAVGQGAGPVSSAPKQVQGPSSTLPLVPSPR